MQTKKVNKPKHDTLSLGFTERLSIVINLKKYSQADLVELSGINKSTISQWVNGNIIPNVKSIHRLCDVLGCRFDWLTTGNGEIFEEEQTKTNNRISLTAEPEPEKKKTSRSEEKQQARQEIEAINEEEAIEQTRYVLRSDTIYRGALVSNIRAFYAGVKREEEMAGVDEKMTEMQAQMDKIMEMLVELKGDTKQDKKREAI